MHLAHVVLGRLIIAPAVILLHSVQSVKYTFQYLVLVYHVQSYYSVITFRLVSTIFQHLYLIQII